MSMHPQRNLFAEFKGKHEVFVETGTYRGDAIELAIEAGFKEIHSIDCDKKNIQFCISRFDFYNPVGSYKDAYVLLNLGDSSEQLGAMIADINEPIMFWLDAHAQYLEGEEESANPYPLLHELQHIGQHMKRTKQPHTILIDDMLHLTHPEITGWNKKAIELTILEMYELAGFSWNIQYFANPVKNSILVAHAV